MSVLCVAVCIGNGYMEGRYSAGHLQDWQQMITIRAQGGFQNY